MMKLLHRSGVCALALMAGTAVMQFEPTVLRDLAFGNGTQHVAVGAVKTSLWSAALAQSSDSFALENVRFTWGPLTYEAQRIEFTGVSVARQELESLFSSSAVSLADRLSKIDAKQVIIPELKVTQKLGKETQTSLYRNATMSDIVRGKVASTVIETTAMEETGEKGPTLISYGRTTVTDLDLPTFVKLFETKDASAPLSRIHGAFSIEKVDVTDAGGNYSTQIARINGRDLIARPTKDSWNGTIALIKELSDKEKTSPEEETRILLTAADLLGAFDAGLVEATGITFKDDSKESKGTGSVARVAYTGATGSQPAEVRVEGIAFKDTNASLKIGSISLTGFSITPTLNGLKALEGKPLTDLDHAAVRSLIPTLGTLRITDMSIDAPAAEDKPNERVSVVWGLMEVTADKPLNGIPTNIRFEQRNVSMTLSDSSDDELAQQLQALGYKSIDSSFVLAATWNESTHEIAIKEFSMDTKDVGSVRLTGLIGNVSPDLFSPDEATASAALIGAKAKSANVVVENRGLVERYLAKAAKEEGTTPEALQKMYSGATPLVLSSMIGNSEQSRTLGQAIARFIEKPGKLTIEAQPKNPSGFGVMDVMLASDPKLLLEKLKITAKAE
ncbi:hypothetical protein DC522_06610 [Microvirga sp. KLBC 81]|uniref:hypothetical protein n=1 Tax=Microvirga sp. KLBC 81 TaxID=1862707 RepID=UPI000D51F01B|nr:hypothetical protein [Microvirga sp. KLBC 81]PVE25199.1 hypothetical protein DC522_06610 [Microvirga sp. KLBC 81]